MYAPTKSIVLDDTREPLIVHDENPLPTKKNETLGVELHTATWFSCTICLCNTLLGAGILGIPYAISNTGWILGALVCISTNFNQIDDTNRDFF